LTEVIAITAEASDVEAKDFLEFPVLAHVIDYLAELLHQTIMRPLAYRLEQPVNDVQAVK
jgi:hypothetical protein